jgi:hypothetical protein
MKRVKDKAILTGRDDLIPKKKWIPASEMSTEMQILNDKYGIFEDGFQQILKKHTMKSKVAFMSLCCATRPFHLSTKWRTFDSHFGKEVDLIVQSNAGIIPENFFESYPYGNYDGEQTIVGTPTYKKMLEKRLNSFLTHHPYPYVLANFRPHQRNTEVNKRVLSLLREKGTIKDFVVIPNDELYERARQSGFGKPNGMGAMFPDCHLYVLNAMRSQLKQWLQ